MKTISIFLFVFFTSISFGQGDIMIDWTRLQGCNFFDQAATSILQTTDGGFVYISTITGHNSGDVSGVNGGQEAWLVKTDVNGSIIWQNSMGGDDSEWGESVLQTIDGGYIVAGKAGDSSDDVSNNIGGYDVWIVKLDANGVIQWDVSLGGTGEDIAYEIQPTSNGGYIVAATSKSSGVDLTANAGAFDFWLIKLDSAGGIEWQKSMGGSGHDEAESVIETSTGDFIIAGDTYSSNGDISLNQGQNDFWVVKTNSTGTILWEKTYGGSGMEDAHRIIETADGGYVIVGASTSQDGDISNPKGDSDFWVIKIDDTGTLLWEKSYGGTGYDYAFDVVETVSGALMVVGITDSNDGDVSFNNGALDAWVIRISATGTLLLEKTIGGSDSDFGTAINKMNNGKIIVGGSSESNDGDVSGNHGVRDIMIAQLRVVGVTGMDELTSDFEVYPNPSSGELTIHAFDDSHSFSIFDITGKEVTKLEMTNETETIQLNVGAGVYFIKNSANILAPGTKLIVN